MYSCGTVVVVVNGSYAVTTVHSSMYILRKMEMCSM